ncbi:endoglycoceramidase isoform X2 [Exaiptasia diaphana]|uniref:Endoglycoceramidase n=1 Tax=Exaiptasia diaphana TaxID=2652724 RepID=A0A913YE91_EXADI|nr:endoglycoceramidase isoform X2 [Exaiptasia diaphana]
MWWLRCIAVFLLIHYAWLCDADLEFISVNPSNQRFIDEQGRERFFHGTNIVVKHFPWHPKTEGFSPESYSEQDMQLLQSLGLNVLRLGFMWPGVEPRRGYYNETYLKVVESMVKLSAKYGIYVLLDMHQDVMSRKFCVEGFPDWAANPGNARKFPEPIHAPFSLDPETNYPSDEDCAKFAWATYYFSEAACVAFQNLYNNTDGLRDRWAAFWAKGAETFKDYPNVIGYELINEPWAGDIYADPLLMVPKIADRLNLAPAYEVLSRAIRAIDDRHCIFFEPVTWDDYGVGFEEVPGGPDYKNRSVLSYHYYHLPTGPSGPVDINFQVRQDDLKRLKCGGMLTEFLTSAGNLSSTLKTMSVADKYLQSWIGWDYKPYYPPHRHIPHKRPSLWNEQGPDPIYVQNTSRTYPQAVAGHAKSYSFDPATLEFHLTYDISSACSSKLTEIYFNQEQYNAIGGGFLVSVEPKSSVKWSSPSKNIVHIEHMLESGTIKVTMIPGQDGTQNYSSLL